VVMLWDAFLTWPPVVQALAATLFTWLTTAFGASVVFWRRSFPQAFLDAMLGFAAGVMIAASYWSLLEPALKLAEGTAVPWMPVAVGFLAGGLFLRALDAVLPHLHVGFRVEEAEGIPTRWRRSVLLVLAVTLHNIPEGLAVGVAFGAVSAGIREAALSGAVALALGIGLQNLPEGVAVSVPLRREGLGRLKSFWYGQLSGAVEPVAAVFRFGRFVFGAASLCFEFRRRGDDFCRRGGSDSRSAAQRPCGLGHHGLSCGFCEHDGLGCGFGITREERRWSDGVAFLFGLALPYVCWGSLRPWRWRRHRTAPTLRNA